MEASDHLPLREATFIILLSLASGPRHGYAIIKDAETMSDGRVKLSTGTLYGAIARLLEWGWIRRTDDRSEQKSGRGKKVYELTEQGRQVFEAEVARLQSLVAAAADSTAGAVA